jgi:hypothetical protein
MFTPAFIAAGWLAVRPGPPALGPLPPDRSVTGVTALPPRNVYFG